MKKIPLILLIKTLGFSIILFFLCWIILGLLLSIPVIHELYETLESFIYYHTFVSTTKPSEHLVVIDEQDKMYDRATYAKLISDLDSLGAKVIAFDVLFSEERDLVTDSALVAATKKASSKIIHAVEFIGYENHAIIPDRFHINLPTKPSPNQFIENINGATLPFKDLLQVTQHLGNVTARSDIARRDEQYFPMLIYYNDRVYSSLPLLAVMKYLDCRTDTLAEITDDAIKLKTNSTALDIPINAMVQTLINFIPPSKFSSKWFSVKEALNHIEENAIFFKNKIILIGNSFESSEQTHGPHFRSYPNLFIYAGIISQILNDENIREGTLESIFLSAVLLFLYIILLIFSQKKLIGKKVLFIYISGFLLFLIYATITLSFRIRTYVILPFLIFSITYALSNKFYNVQIYRRSKTVFISYSHHDFDFAKKLKAALESEGFRIKIDIETLQARDEIQEFMIQSVRNTDFTVSIVSKESLKSENVMVESLECLRCEEKEKKIKFIPVFLDKHFLDDGFLAKVIEEFDDEIVQLMENIKNMLSKKQFSIDHLEYRKDKLIDLRKHIHIIFKKLNESLVLDFSSDDKFNENLPKLIDVIRKAK